MADRVLLAEPRGFCAGVEMAIQALTWMVRVFEPPVYRYHEIVHNVAVVEVFQKADVVFVDDDVHIDRLTVAASQGRAILDIDFRPCSRVGGLEAWPRSPPA